jgi:hypothetical protein
MPKEMTNKKQGKTSKYTLLKLFSKPGLACTGRNMFISMEIGGAP